MQPSLAARGGTARRCCTGRGARRSAVCAAAPPGRAPLVVLTREQGKNDKMQAGLSRHGISCIELPLIEHSDGPDRQRLPSVLRTQPFQWVAITSPEAASVFIEAWEEAGKPEVHIAVVGGGTGEVLQAAGITPKYTSTKATAKVMGAELPLRPDSAPTVLYPASAKASTDLQESLTAAGFTVTRLNTYNTSGVKNVAPELLQSALAADIVTFGSPSAVKAWVSLVGLEIAPCPAYKQAASQRLSVCIGSTSARACDAAGLPKARVYYPASPGVEGWVASVLEACTQHGLLSMPAVVA